MRDICIKTSSLSALVAALKPLGLELTNVDEDGQDRLSTAGHSHALVYCGRVVQTPGTYDTEGHEVTPPTFYPGGYAVLRGNELVISTVLAATLPVGVDIVSPPVGLPLIGGVWLAGEAPPTLADVRADKRAAIQTRKVQARDGGFLVNGVRFDSDGAARIAYIELAMRLQASATFSTAWKASDGVWVTMNAALYAQVAAAGEAHVSAAFARQAELDAALDACTTIEAVNALNIETGWPG